MDTRVKSQRIVVTGGSGFIGWHLRCHLHASGTAEAISLVRDDMRETERTAQRIAGSEAVVHLAGVNRASDYEVERGNLTAAEQLIEILGKAGFKGVVVYASTIHAGHDNPYGRGKSAAARILNRAAELHGWRLKTIFIPHVFGEHCRPHYNSAVATFAHSIVRGEHCAVNRPGQLELIYVGDVARRLHTEALRAEAGEVRLSGHPISVGEVFDLLDAQWREYSLDEIPALKNDLELQLFNTLRSYAFPAFYPREFNLKTDPRGSLAEIIRARRGGQVFFSLTHPGFTRGDHFHFHKLERFAVMQGQARIEVRRLLTDEVVVFELDGARPGFVDMPVLHTHSIRNTGEGPLLTLFWAHEFFDPKAPDTVAEPVRQRGVASCA